jgi:hypothetical protein
MRPLIRPLIGPLVRQRIRQLVPIAFVTGCAIAAAAAAPPADTPAPTHPLLGIWVLNLPQLGCSETYHFRGDGTTLVNSAAEVSESAFTVSARPSIKGYYKLEDRVVKDNGKPDCSGEVTKVGTRAANYVLFDPAGKRFVMCNDESLRACIGPFERVPGEGI